MQEQLISFETAKLAKEKGFYLDYVNDGADNYDNDGNLLNETDERYYTQVLYTASTQSLLQKWIREVHKIHISISKRFTNPSENNDWYFCSFESTTMFRKSSDAQCGGKTYEEALESGLQHALKLINNENTN